MIRGEGEKAKGVKADKGVVSPHVLDGFWVQCQISEIYPDPVTAADKAAFVLGILGSESSLHDVENQLIELFEFLSFHTVIVWYTKLARSNADERIHVEVAMRETGVGWILRELAGDRQIKATTDIIDVSEVKLEVPKTATLGDPGRHLPSSSSTELKQAIPSRIRDRRANFTLCTQGAGKVSIHLDRISYFIDKFLMLD